MSQLKQPRVTAPLDKSRLIRKTTFSYELIISNNASSTKSRRENLYIKFSSYFFLILFQEVIAVYFLIERYTPWTRFSCNTDVCASPQSIIASTLSSRRHIKYVVLCIKSAFLIGTTVRIQPVLSIISAQSEFQKRQLIWAPAPISSPCSWIEPAKPARHFSRLSSAPPENPTPAESEWLPRFWPA